LVEGVEEASEGGGVFVAEGQRAEGVEVAAAPGVLRRLPNLLIANLDINALL
jgi:hypothetical protein